MPPGHDMAIAAVGGVILWFGWYGFNPGSTLSAMDFEGIGRVAANTTLAACAAGLVGDVLRLSTISEVGHGHLDQRLPRRTRRDHVSVLLGLAVRCDLYRRDRRCGRRPRRRLARMAADRRPDRCVAGARLVRHLGHVAVSGCSPPVSTACPTPPGADNSTPFKGLFYGGGFHQLQFQIFGSVVICSCDVRDRAGRDVRASRRSACCASRRSTSSKVSTSSSTARRRTTPSSRTWATRRSRREVGGIGLASRQGAELLRRSASAELERGDHMHLVTAIIKPHRLEAVTRH